MRIIEIEKLFEEEKFDEILEAMEEDFNLVDRYAKNMKLGITNNPEEVKIAMNKLTGVFSNLRTVYSLAETKKKNEEEQAFHSAKIKAQKNENKFTAASGKRQASLDVANLRRMRNIIEGYKDSCEKAIGTMQSLLKYMGIEYNQPTD